MKVVVKTTIKGTGRTFIYLMASMTDVNESVPGGCEGPQQEGSEPSLPDSGNNGCIFSICSKMTVKTKLNVKAKRKASFHGRLCV